MRSKGLEQVPLHEHATDAPRSARDGARQARPSEPVPVRVWVVSGRGREFLAETAEADAWTVCDHPQVHVRYIDPGGREGFAWVWASAVRRV